MSQSVSQYSSRNATVLKVKPSEIRPGDIIIGPTPTNLPSGLHLVHLQRGQEQERGRQLLYPPRPSNLRRTSSLDRDDFRPRHDERGPTTRRRIRRRRARSASRDQSDSEGSIPPRPRRAASAKSRRRRPRSKRNDSRSDKDGNSSSSDLGCTDDDEKMKKKTKWKKWASIGLAGVATIHAVHGGYETYEKTQARHKEQAEGKISEQEAQKKKKTERWRTAADVGIAAVWIKSAYDEIKEYREVKKEYDEVCEKSEERHRKRIERAKEMKSGKYRGQHALEDVDRYLSDQDERDDR